MAAGGAATCTSGSPALEARGANDPAVSSPRRAPRKRSAVAGALGLTVEAVVGLVQLVSLNVRQLPEVPRPFDQRTAAGVASKVGQ